MIEKVTNIKCNECEWSSTAKEHIENQETIRDGDPVYCPECDCELDYTYKVDSTIYDVRSKKVIWCNTNSDGEKQPSGELTCKSCEGTYSTDRIYEGHEDGIEDMSELDCPMCGEYTGKAIKYKFAIIQA